VQITAYILIALAAYLLGSIPTGYLVARAKGVDIRTVGSGNIGATNVFRILGKPAGIFVLLVDALKGWVAVRIAAFWLVDTLLPPDSLGGSREISAIIAALFAVLGHNYTCWLRFKGGKGIATSAGVLTALVPWALLIILATWIVVFVLTRYVSLGSLAAAAVLPFATWFTTQSILLTVVTSAMSALAIYKHKGNIQRLLNGTESRINFKKKDDTK
jgi:glycerol-3-phosphate acyltransferase PlsY